MSRELPDIIKKTTKDHVVGIVKAVLATLPWCGGIATLIDEYIPKSTDIAIKKFFEYFGERIEELENKVDFEKINEDDFSETFKSCYLGVTRTARDEKIKIFARIFANIFIKEGESEKVEYEELDHLLRVMDNISIGSLRVLIIAYKNFKDNKNRRFNFGDLFKNTDNMHVSLVFGLINELDTANILHIVSYPTVITNDYENIPIEISELGMRFIKNFAYDL